MSPANDLIDVFGSYDGGVIFQSLTGAGGGPGILGSIGWIFTGFGAFFVLWGFVLRTRGGSDGSLSEIARTWVVIGFMLAGPLLMRAAMQSSDSIMESTIGSPRHLTAICVKAAYAMPELSALFDALRKSDSASEDPSASAQNGQLLDRANDGSVLGYLEAFGIALWDTGGDYASKAAGTWKDAVRMITLMSGFGSAMLKCLVILLALLPVYLLLLCSAAIVWFMAQIRFFLAITGTMMLPLFVGMYSLPAGHTNRQAATNYVMQMVSLALWPLAWTLGHSGTVALYNALISLIAGTSRVPAILDVLQWSSIDSGSISAAQIHSMEPALGNWFAGNIASLLAILVGSVGFFIWVLTVTVLGPVFLHRLLSSGSHFMLQALEATGKHGGAAARLAGGAVQAGIGAVGTPALAAAATENGILAGSKAVSATALPSWPHPGSTPASLAGAAQAVARNENNNKTAK